MKSINRSIIKELRNYTDNNYAVVHIQEASTEYGRDKIALLIEKIIRFSNLLPHYLNDLQKATLMYQIVTETVTYDHKENDDEKYTYLKALFKGSAVCMGIAELYYILCTACGLKCNIVVGYSTDSEKDDAYHAWNQVRLTDSNNKTTWYMADPTWDLSENNHEWKYFMKSDLYFRLHGHYWLTGDYVLCQNSLDNPTPFSDSVINRIIAIFQDIVCQE